MSLLKNLSTDASIADEKDSVGGSVLESGLYTSKVTLAYVTKSKGGATGLVLKAKTDAGRDINQTLWMTSGTDKGAKNFFEKDGVKSYLPGFIAANALSLLTTGKDIAELDTETKVVNVYSSEAKAEVPTKVEMVVDLLGKDIIIGLIKQTVDKNVKNDAGVYVASGETRDENEIDKFFRAEDRMTTAEIRAGASEPAFYTTWATRWNGNTRNKAKGAGSAGTAGAPKAAAAGMKKPTTSLFG